MLKDVESYNYTAEEILDIEKQVLAERRQGSEPLYYEDVKVTDNYGFYIGNLLELNRQDITLTLGGTYPTWDFRSPGATSNTVGGMVLPHLDAPGFAAIDTTTTPPVNGTLVFTDAGPGVTPLKLWWTAGPSGATWYNVAVV